MNDDSSLLCLLDSCREGGKCDARDLPERFRAIVATLDTLGIPAVFIGRVAYGLYASAQFTQEIDVLLGIVDSHTRWNLTLPALDVANISAGGAGSTVKLVVHPAHNQHEVALISLTPRVQWLGCSARLAGIEHLFVRFLSAGTGENSSLAVQTAMENEIDMSKAAQIGAVLGVTDHSIKETIQRAVRDKSSSWRADHGGDENSDARSAELATFQGTRQTLTRR